MVAIPDSVKAVSFDIFDTALVRFWARPHDVFHQLEHELSVQDARWSGFARQRIDAEFELRKSNGFTAEVTLADIYGVVGSRMGFADADIARAMELELALEQEAITANPDVSSQIGEIRTSGRRILFMSDIYLPREFVARLLEKNALLGPVDGLYVSSEVGLQKSTGALFDHVLAKEGLKPAELLHIGDSQAWDVDMPRKRGVRALHYEQSKLSRYEENLLHGISADSLKLSRFAGAVRFARLSCPYDNLQSRTVWRLPQMCPGR